MTFRWPNGQYYFERIPLSQNIEYHVKGEKTPRGVGKRVRVRFIISLIFGLIMSHFSFIPCEACVQNQFY